MFSIKFAVLAALVLVTTSLAGEKLDPIAVDKWATPAGRDKKEVAQAVVARAHALVDYLESGNNSPISTLVSREDYLEGMGMTTATVSSEIPKWRLVHVSKKKTIYADAVWGVGTQTHELVKGPGRPISDVWTLTNAPKNPKGGEKVKSIDLTCLNIYIHVIGTDVVPHTIRYIETTEQDIVTEYRTVRLPSRREVVTRYEQAPPQARRVVQRYMSGGRPLILAMGMARQQYPQYFAPPPPNQGLNAPYGPGAVTQVGGNVNVTATANAGGGSGDHFRALVQTLSGGTPAAGLTPSPMGGGNSAAGLTPPAGAVIRTIGSPLAAPR